jgi:hypothetical protein
MPMAEERMGDAGLGLEVGRLLAFGLQPRLRPPRAEGYTELIRRYRSDAKFRELVEGVAEGLGLVVLDAGDFGLVLGAAEGSVFAWNLDNYRRDMGVDDRLLHGLIHLGIAAYCYPTAESLDPEEERVSRRISAAAIERDLRDTCQRLEERLGAEDVPEAAPELERALAMYLAQAPTKETKIRARKTTLAMIQFALERLSEQGLMTKVSDADSGTYLTLARYQIHVRELAAYEGFRMLAAARREV